MTTSPRGLYSTAAALLHSASWCSPATAILRELERRPSRRSTRSRPDQIGPASIDLHLGDEIRVMDGGGERGRGHRRRRLPDDHARAAARRGPTCSARARPSTGSRASASGCRRTSRAGSRAGAAIARLGLMIHVTSGFVAPGVDSRQVLEMSNVARHPLADPRRRARCARSSCSAARAARSTPGASRARIACELAPASPPGFWELLGFRIEHADEHEAVLRMEVPDALHEPLRDGARRRHRDALRHRPRDRDRAPARARATASRPTT